MEVLLGYDHRTNLCMSHRASCKENEIMSKDFPLKSKKSMLEVCASGHYGD